MMLCKALRRYLYKQRFIAIARRAQARHNL